jgi:hypothetical protein
MKKKLGLHRNAHFDALPPTTFTGYASSRRAGTPPKNKDSTRMLVRVEYVEPPVSNAPQRVEHYGFTGSVFFVSSVLITVPSDFSVTVFSWVFSVPSLFTVVFSSCEIVRSQPTNKTDNASADVVARILILVFI